MCNDLFKARFKEMDEELKDIVKSLAGRVKAMQAKVSTLRSEVTRSDNSNLLADSQ